MKAAAHPFQTDDPRLRPIHEKILAQEALAIGDVAGLYASKDILAIGWLANFVRERRHGNATVFNVDRIAESGAEKIVVAGKNVEETIREVESVRKVSPQAQIAGCTVEELTAQGNPAAILKRLRAAGADSLIGGGVEVFHSAIRPRIWQQPGTAEKRAEIRQAARAAGLGVPLYVVEREAAPEQQALELLSLREFSAENFSALSFEADASTSSLNLAATTGMQELKQIAIARLALDNVPHIRAYWQMLGGKLAQIALRFGASHLDGTSLEAIGSIDERRREVAREIEVAGGEAVETPSRNLRIL